MTDGPSWLTLRPIAHRGYHDLNAERWENTLSAFRAAAEKDFAIECDVHLSSDGVPVVFHDAGLHRLTGREGSVFLSTAGELAQMKVGGTEDHVPTLAEMLAAVGGRVPIVIEIKSPPCLGGTAPEHEGVASAVARALDGYRGQAAIMSFDHDLVRRFAQEAPGIPGGLTAMGTGTADLERHFSMLAHGISFVSFQVKELPNRFTETVRKKLGIPVVTWTVRDEAGRRLTRDHADQMTFEGFDPDALS